MDFRGLLTALATGKVDFIVVGGVSAVLQGAPMTTQDLDIVPSRSEANLKRLVLVLRELEAAYRELLPEKTEPTEVDLSSDLHHLLQTRLGPLDVLGTVHGGLDYEDLVPRSRTIRLESTLLVRALDLHALIEIKDAIGRDKDRAQLPLLRSTLRERERSRSGGSSETEPNRDG